MFWINIARIIIPGIILGLIIGKILTKRPYYLELLSPRFWLKSAKQKDRKKWIRIISLSIIIGISTFFIQLGTSHMIVNYLGRSLLAKENIFSTIAQISLPLLIVSVTLLPILEEWIFRGILLEELSRIAKSKWAGLLLSALLFSIFHLSNPGTYATAAISYFIGGIVIGIGYLAGGLSVAVSGHVLYNIIPFIFSLLG